MHALSPRRLPFEPDHTAEIISFAELSRARARRALDRADDRGDPPAEAHPWAYCFPRPGTAKP
jgi:hypothetical protein